MAITDVRRLRKLQISETKGQKGTIQLTGSEEYVVICDTANPSFSDIAANTDTWPKIGGKIPQINDAAFFSGFSLNVTTRQFSYLDDENEFAVRIAVQYDSKADEETNENDKPQNEDPDTWHRVSITTQSASVPLTDQGFDGQKGGLPACNSAGDPVDGLTEDRALVKYTYTNTKVVNPNFQKLLSYVNKTNSDRFLGAGARELRCMGFSGEWDDKNQLWSISVEFLYDPEGWVVKYFDAGFNEIVDGKRRAILDIQGNPVSKPVPLDGTGKAVEPGLVGTGSQAGDTFILTAYPYFQDNFANLFQECGI